MDWGGPPRVEGGRNDARRILTEKQHELEALAKGLLEYETLTGDEIRNLLNGQPPVRDSGDSVSPVRGSAVPNTRPRRAPGDRGGMEPPPPAEQKSGPGPGLAAPHERP